MLCDIPALEVARRVPCSFPEQRFKENDMSLRILNKSALAPLIGGLMADLRLG